MIYFKSGADRTGNLVGKHKVRYFCDVIYQNK